MSAKTGKIKTFGKIITYTVLILAVVALAGFIAYFTDGFNTSFKTFYVKRGEQTILERAAIALPANEEIRFDIKYTFDFLNQDEPKGYDVEVLTNVTKDNNFEFTIDGRMLAFSGEKDWTSVFDIKRHEDYFTINLRGDMYMQDLLNRKYAGKTVVAPPVTISQGYFTLAVTSYNGSATVYIDFYVYIGVDGVEIIGGDIVL